MSSTTTTTTTTTKTYSNSEYLQPSLTHSYDSSQSPLALLAQTCSSIGKDCPLSPVSISNSAPSQSLVTKSSSSNVSNSDKSFSSTKTSTLSQLNNVNTNKKSTLSLKTKPISTPSSFIDPNLFTNSLPPLFDSSTSVAALLLRSSLAYLSSQQHSYSTLCPIPGCLQCETVRYLFPSSINHQPYICHWKTCNARFSSNNELIEHIQYNHRTSKTSNYSRFHPYLKPSNIINPNDQLPFFYPYLSLSSMTETTRRLNNNPDNNN